MQTNMASISLPPSTKALRIVDVPGHPRIRDQFREYMPDAKAVAFVVDASTVSRNGAAVAEYVMSFTFTSTLSWLTCSLRVLQASSSCATRA